MKKVLLSALLLSTTVFAQAEQFNANELTLTKVSLDSTHGGGQCYVDILSVPKGVIKHYISIDKADRESRYDSYSCFIHLLHKKTEKIAGKSITYTAFESEKLSSYGGNSSYYISFPTEIKSTKIPSSK